MNILLTSTGILEDREHKALIDGFRERHHLIEALPLERLIGYLRFEPGSKYAAIDAILCKADTDPEAIATYTLPMALRLAEDFRTLPESCAMRDGRKWKSIPFIVISEQPFYFGYPDEIARLGVTIVKPSPYPDDIVVRVSDTVDEYIRKILLDYEELGLMVSFERGRARIGPALKKKDPELESAFYYSPADRRNNRRWLTVMRDRDGVRADVDLFQQLLDMKVSERQMQAFFEENPFFLTQVQLGLQIPHLSYSRNRWSPDFAFTSILGFTDSKRIGLLEIKGPSENLLNAHQHQVRDYGRYIHHPENERRILKQIGYIPTSSKLAVLIGRTSDLGERVEVFDRRRSEVLEVEIITYDQILETQADQMSRIVLPRAEYPTVRLPNFDPDVLLL
jgi:hypothetical protein